MVKSGGSKGSEMCYAPWGAKGSPSPPGEDERLKHITLGIGILAFSAILIRLLDPAGGIVVLMLSGGQALENFAVRKVSPALAALARRMPLLAHRINGGEIENLAIVQPGNTPRISPPRVCPVNAIVAEEEGG